MAVRTHELHAATIHLPLVLLPAAALFDLGLVTSKRRPGRRSVRLGHRLWRSTAVSGLVAGVAGMAASQEIRAEDRHAKDMMWLHGVGNVALVLGAASMAAWRKRHRPTLLQSVLGLAAAAISGYTAYLGGELVYGHGVGVEAMPDDAEHGVGDSPPLLSARGPGRLLLDSIKGAWWLVTRSREAARQPEALRHAATH